MSDLCAHCPSFLTFSFFLFFPLHPIRMYFVDEDGTEKPTAEALRALDTIVMFHSESWAMAIVDMVSFIFFVIWYPSFYQQHPYPVHASMNPHSFNSSFRMWLLFTRRAGKR